MTTTADATRIAEVAAKVDRRLAAFLDAEVARWREVDIDLVAAVESLRGLVLSGGKRLRPAFCHWGFVGAGGAADDTRSALIGSAFELLHAFALVHDDVVDDSTTRRGSAAVHVTFADRHRAEGLRGESRRFGEGVAVLVGDLAHVYADELLTSALDGTSEPRATLRLWNELRVELNMGQYLDVLGTARADTDPARAWRIARYKSAKYTIERPLHLGCLVAGGSRTFDELGPHLSAYGVPLGEAFQMRDDVLGVFGDAAVTGKPVGDDLREGKPTPLLAAAHARSGSADGALLDLVGTPGLGHDDIAGLQALFVSCGALDEIEGAIERLRNEALAAVEASPLPLGVQEALRALAWFVTDREA